MSLSTVKHASPDFRHVARLAKTSAKQEARKPFCIRLSDDERALLERMAGNKPVGAYSREKLLSGAHEPRKAAKPTPKTDYVLLGQILAALGKSELASSLCLLAVAAESGSLPVTGEIEEELKQACNHVRNMRGHLIKALGIRSET